MWSSRKAKKEKLESELDKKQKGGAADHKHHFTMLDPDSDVTAQDIYNQNDPQNRKFIQQLQARNKEGQFVDTLNMHEDRK